jgi:hypothetical protein
MATPRMFVIAGPPGAGKSSVFSLSKFAQRTFNADDRAAELNSGFLPGYLSFDPSDCQWRV